MQSCAKEAWGGNVLGVRASDERDECRYRQHLPAKTPLAFPWLRLKQPPSKPHSPPPQRPDANYGSPTPEIHEATTTTNAVFNPVNWV